MGVKELYKRKFFKDFSNNFPEIFDEVKDISMDFTNTDKLNDFLHKQNNLISLRVIYLIKNIYPKDKKEVQSILKKQNIILKFSQAKSIESGDRVHLCIIEDYGTIKFDKSIFVTFDSNLSKKRMIIEDIFKSIKIMEPDEYNMGGF